MKYKTANTVRKLIGLFLSSIVLACQSGKITQPGRGDIIIFRNASIRPGGAIYFLALDGSAPIQLPDNSTSITCPIVSPDGQRIAFVRTTSADQAGAVSVMDIDGRNISPVTPPSFSRNAPANASSGPNPNWQLGCPAWSADSKRLSVFRHIGQSKAAGTSELYSINADGTNLKLLATGDAFDAVAWSPVGERILLNSHLYTDGGPYGFATSIVNADGSGTRPVAKSVAGLGWAPSGSMIAVLCGRNYTIGDRQLCVGDPDGVVVAVTDTSAGATDPTWSPDGTRIAFGCRSAVCLINPDGSAFQRFTAGAAFEPAPTWSPDSKRIAYVCGATPTARTICIMNADGSDARTLVTLPGENSDVSWVTRSQ